MSEVRLKDGSGLGFFARISKNLKLQTNSISLPARLEASDDQRAFSINTDLITITNDLEVGVLYLKNNQQNDIRIDGIGIGFESSNGTGGVRIRVYRNPTAGTLISTATRAPVESNSNFGSTETLEDSDVFKGGGILTVTDGAVHTYTSAGTNFGTLLTTAIVIPKGKSIAVTYTAPSGNTSMNCNCVFLAHLVNPDN